MIDSIFTSKKIFFHANILSYYIEIVNILNNVLKYSSMLTENLSLKDSLHFDKVWIRNPDPGSGSGIRIRIEILGWIRIRIQRIRIRNTGQHEHQQKNRM